MFSVVGTFIISSNVCDAPHYRKLRVVTLKDSTCKVTGERYHRGAQLCRRSSEQSGTGVITRRGKEDALLLALSTVKSTLRSSVNVPRVSQTQ